MDALSLSRRGRSLTVVLILASAAFMGLLASAPNVAAATTHYLAGSACTGSSTPTWVTGDTWVLYGDVMVDLGCTLTIQAGVVVQADPNVHLYVSGALRADGTAADPIRFVNNQTTVTPWTGIKFNAGSAGSVTWSDFNRVQVAVNVTSSAPALNNNTILLASGGLWLDTSASVVADNVIDGHAIGSVGIVLRSASATVERNLINGTVVGVQAMTSGTVVLTDNRITNVSGVYALGMYIDHQSSALISGNVVQNVTAKDATTAGGQGQSAAAILVSSTASVTVQGNTVGDVRGGRGGDGGSSLVVAGTSGGSGGPAVGIAIGAAKTVVVQGNTISGIQGGRGGDGGSSSVLDGGNGGVGGYAIGIELFSATGNVTFDGNTVQDSFGGNGGTGGQSGGTAVPNGRGGAGSDAYGVFSLGGQNASLSGNNIRTLTGGSGGSSSSTPSSRGVGGPGGNVTGAIAVINGAVAFTGDTISALAAGAGGDAVTLGGHGGGATAILALGTSVSFNSTLASHNQVSSIIGGAGGIGGTLSGDGGNATGVTALHVNISLASNQVAGIQGGAGGVSFKITNQASRGGDAGAMALFAVPDGSSLQDSISSVVGGLPGGTVAPEASRGAGFYFAGSNTIESRVQVTNGTIASTGNFDLYVDNYTEVTTLNTPFSSSKVAVMAAGNLTVRNFLTARVLWPNNLTEVWGARVVVTDNAVVSYNQTRLFSGTYNWIVVTNRVYSDSSVPTWNATRVTASYQTFLFANNPRNVNLTVSQTQTFTMNDTTAPSSSAVALPTWTTTRIFPVYVTATDVFGVGVANVTLWYRLNGAGWVAYGTTSSLFLGIGQFSFAAPADGLYEFATTAIDKAGNAQVPSPPTANNTWTIVDTVAPATHVLALPRYETSLTFTVAWAPDTGVTDVANYTVQVDTGSGWSDWVTNTTTSSGTYTAAAQGPIAFRTLAFDFAGNRETKSGNDTWTVVDTIAPQVTSSTPVGNLSASPTAIRVTFSEPMNESSVETAFSLAPVVAGTFVWSNGSTTLTFQPSQPLAAGTTYAVVIDNRGKDAAGNALAQSDVFTFTTPAGPAAGLSLGDLWPLLVVVAAALAAIAFFLVRRRGAAEPETVVEPAKPAPPPAPPKTEAAIDDVFLLNRGDGILIKHETRRLRPDIDTDILSGMLTAVQQFVKDSFRGEEGEELNEMTVGQMHILIGRGKWLILAATITGGDIESMTAQIQRCVQDMEDHNWDRLEDWDGDIEIAKVLGPYLKKLIRGEYAA